MKNKFTEEVHFISKEEDIDEDFIKIRNEMKEFLAERNLFPQIAKQLGISINSVRRTFELSNSEKELKGNRWQIWNAAIDLIYNIKTSVDRAQKVLNL